MKKIFSFRPAQSFWIWATVRAYFENFFSYYLLTGQSDFTIIHVVEYCCQAKKLSANEADRYNAFFLVK